MWYQELNLAQHPKGNLTCKIIGQHWFLTVLFLKSELPFVFIWQPHWQRLIQNTLASGPLHLLLLLSGKLFPPITHVAVSSLHSVQVCPPQPPQWKQGSPFTLSPLAWLYFFHIVIITWCIIILCMNCLYPSQNVCFASEDCFVLCTWNTESTQLIFVD